MASTVLELGRYTPLGYFYCNNNLSRLWNAFALSNPAGRRIFLEPHHRSPPPEEWGDGDQCKR